MSTTLSIIVNPSAGGGRAKKALEGVKIALDRRDVTYQVHETRDLSHARMLAVQASADGHLAGALGGDGLVGAVAAGCAEGGGVMAILPGGRGNDLARVLEIPTAPDEAVGVALDGQERRMDLGDGNGVPFCCIASCGFDSDANRIANETRIPGAASYLYAAIKAVLGWKTAVFTITADGVEQTLEGFGVIAANSKAYGGGMFIAPDADVTDGLLDLVTIAGTSRLRFLGLLPTVFKGNHVGLRDVTVSRAEKIEIKADRPFTVYADGDPLCELPAVISVRKDAVRIMLPAPK